MALNSNSLTTLSFAKKYLKIPSGELSLDEIVEFWINVASEMLETSIDRKLKAQSGIEIISGRKANFIMPRQWPINSITEIRIDDSGVFTDANTILDPADYSIAENGTCIVKRRGLFPYGFNNVKLTYNYGFTVVPSDIENACLWMVSYYHKMRDAGDIGRTSKGKGDESTSILQDAPQDVKDVIARYRRIEFANSPLGVKNE